MMKKMNKKEKLLELARAVALVAHDGQVDKAGVDYFEHPKTVSERCHTLDGKIVGFLHDVVEDTTITLEDLRNIGFEEVQLEALSLVTKVKDENYSEDLYYERIKQNEIAREVKLADLSHNLELGRLKGITDRSLLERMKKKKEKYLERQRFLL